MTALSMMFRQSLTSSMFQTILRWLWKHLVTTSSNLGVVHQNSLGGYQPGGPWPSDVEGRLAGEQVDLIFRHSKYRCIRLYKYMYRYV